MKRLDDNVISAESVPSETYGWSAEEVLLKAFNVPTDRSRYLAVMVGDFMRSIAEKTVSMEDAMSQVDFFRETAAHLNNADPMKKILDTIICNFSS